MPSAYASLKSVWTIENASSVEKSEAELLDLYSDDLAVGWLITDESEDATAALVDRHFAPIEVVRDELDANWIDAIKTLELANQALVRDPHFQSFDACPKVAPEPDVEEFCRPYPAQATTLLFGADTPHESDMELALRSVVSTDAGEMYIVRPATAGERSPTPELLDNSDIKLQPSPSSGPLRDAVSQVLDFYPSDEVLETAPEYMPKREGRSLMYAHLARAEHCDIVDLDDDEVPVFDEQGQHIKREITHLDVDNGPREWAVEYDSVLRRITRYSFLPGHEHLTAPVALATFLQHEDDIQALYEATTAFLNDRRDGECVCLDNKVRNVVLPGENFLLAEIENPTAESLLDLIDELVNSSSVENAAQSLDVSIKETPSLGALFDTECQQYTNYTALDQFSGSSADVSSIACAQSDAASDVSDNEGDELSMIQPSQLSYYDADTLQYLACIAFDQLWMDLDEDDEFVPRIHRAENNYDESDVDGILELYEVPSNESATEFANSPLPVVFNDEVNLFELDFASQLQPVSDTQQSRTPYNMRSSHNTMVRHRPQLTVITQLDDVEEESSYEDIAPPSSTSSDSSIDFAGQRGFVKPLSTRRADFLDDEDSDVDIAPLSFSSSGSSVDIAGQRGSVWSLSTRRSDFLDGEDSEDKLDVAQSAYSPVPSEHTPDRDFVPIVIEDMYQFFADDIWESVPDLPLALPRTSIRPVIPTAERLPHPDGLVGFETVLYNALAYTFECINNGRTDVLPVLGCDIQWALSLFVSEFPVFGLLDRLGGAVEILLEQLAASGTN